MIWIFSFKLDDVVDVLPVVAIDESVVDGLFSIEINQFIIRKNFNVDIKTIPSHDVMAMTALFLKISDGCHMTVIAIIYRLGKS